MSKKPVRIRTLVPKAMEIFEEIVTKHGKKLEQRWEVLMKHITSYQNLDKDVDLLTVKSVKSTVINLFTDFDKVSAEFLHYLTSVNSSESLFEVKTLNEALEQRRATVREFLDRLKILRDDLAAPSTVSKKSSKSRTSRASKASKVDYAEKVAALNLEAIEVKKRLLREKEELRLLAEDEDSESCDESDNSGKPLNLPTDNSQLRTANYVTGVSSDKKLNPAAQVFYPPSCHQSVADHHTDMNYDLSKYLLKKDMLLTRLSMFNDQAEYYHGWKETFKSIVIEIGANSYEEIDLLLKWLGPNSKRQAMSLKCAYISNPNKAITKIWERLDERFGSPELTYQVVTNKLDQFPRLNPKQPSQLYDLSDILSEIEGLMYNPNFASVLSYFDTAIGINPIVSKLPTHLQEKWTMRATYYKEKYKELFPPFSEFSAFIREQSKIRNNPSFVYEGAATTTSYMSASKSTRGEKVVTRKTTYSDNKCPIHRTPHKLSKCKVFLAKSLEEKKKFLFEKRLCFKCGSSQHGAKSCSKSENILSNVAKQSESENAADSYHRKSSESQPATNEVTNRSDQQEQTRVVASKCTEICGSLSNEKTKSCSKIILVNAYLENNVENTVKCYCIIDEQSNRSLIKPKLLSLLGFQGESHEYLLKTCHGSMMVSGRRANNVVIQSLDRSCIHNLPTLIECAQIPCDKDEICKPENARRYHHLQHIADQIPQYDENADILLLLGRDCLEAHHVLDQVLGPAGTPFAQKLGLGWVVIGQLCVGKIHANEVVNVNKTYLLEDGRASLFQPCCDHLLSVQDPLFIQTPNANKPSLSVDDREFLEIMDSQVQRNPDGGWVAPLPLRSGRPRLPNNRSQAINRSSTLVKSLQKDPDKKAHFFDFMGKLLSNDHAELAPDLRSDEECWYLPIFGVYHPKKPNQVRVVFDSSAKFEGISLNSVLLQGPDLTNSLLGVLMRFRKDSIAILADIEQMFYSFSVREDHRNLLRFLWFKDNDPSKEIVEYRMCKHPVPRFATSCQLFPPKRVELSVKRVALAGK